jgi:hypothetical protein
MITIESIRKIAINLDNDCTSRHSKEIDVFLESINDWDDPVSTIEDYEFGLRNFLGGSLKYDYDQIVYILKQKEIADQAWKIESVSGLIRLLKIKNSNVTLQEVLDQLKVEMQKLIMKPNFPKGQ